jgi:hypothetical protein
MSKQKTPEMLRARTLASGLEYDPSKYEFSSSFVPADVNNPWDIHTTAELVACLERNKDIELDAKVITTNGSKRLDRQNFSETYHSNNTNLKESDFDSDSGTGLLVGQDYTPYLGGPFYKNLYFYQDYIRMHAQAFFSYHNDPVAKAVVSITRDFTLGRGFRVDSDNKAALVLWRAFDKVNKIQELFNQIGTELSIYGEHMIWWLPNSETQIGYQLPKGDSIPTAFIPRIRLIDPSNIVEIITYPEDISRRIAYVWLAPTQYQIYTSGKSSVPDSKVQPTLKFIYRQIPADQVMHVTVNSVSNEKRGRSDLFPVLGYMKRLRDAVEFEMISHQKQAAWSIDTQIEGSQADIDAYIQDMASQGTITQAGSEFVHTAKIKREFMSAKSGASGSQEIFNWCLSMISVGTQIPTNYFGTHLSGAGTRASAVVATEPVAKKFEMRQLVYERMVKEMWDKLMAWAGIDGAECEITFPDIITQDRSAKLKDLALSQSQKWLSRERAATIAAKELGITDFEFKKEMESLSAEEPQPSLMSPLSTPGSIEPKKPITAIPSSERRDIKRNDQQ